MEKNNDKSKKTLISEVMSLALVLSVMHKGYEEKNFTDGSLAGSAVVASVLLPPFARTIKYDGRFNVKLNYF